MATSDWYQQVLTPPEVVELRIRLGLIPSTDHCQVLVELFDPVSGVQQAQASIPHERIAQWPHLLDWARGKADEWVAEAVEPF